GRALAGEREDADARGPAGARPAVRVQAEGEPVETPRSRRADEDDAAALRDGRAGDAETAVLCRLQDVRRRRTGAVARCRVEEEAALRKRAARVLEEPRAGVLHVAIDGLVPELVVAPRALVDEECGRDRV